MIARADGRRTLGVMINVGEVAPPSVYDAFIRVYRDLAAQLLA